MDSKEERFRLLEEENQKLKMENEILMRTVEQMSGTLNRLLNRYVTGNADS
ncbi:MAG: hypothetical protein MR868_14940 [Lachnospiraceae bacterium]|nr:hypothetical protein [Lachnospiraceae bacterium]